MNPSIQILVDGAVYPFSGAMRQGMPVIWVRIRKQKPRRPGELSVQFDCPLCGKKHVHGLWENDFGPSLRVPDCRYYEGSYFIQADPHYLPGGPSDYRKKLRGSRLFNS